MSTTSGYPQALMPDYPPLPVMLFSQRGKYCSGCWPKVLKASVRPDGLRPVVRPALPATDKTKTAARSGGRSVYATQRLNTQRLRVIAVTVAVAIETVGIVVDVVLVVLVRGLLEH